ncbi:MAG: carboxypeptidase-like regulatory domain-containing protein [Isosphaeraceae bacterium]|nr:carboxypeptidase-like regulatory domain-containing protein [Isosphaeraceae bacterium]
MTLTALGCRNFGDVPWPLPNAPISITDLAGNELANGTTDADGQFAFSGGTAGQIYVCTITAKRFNFFSKKFTFACGGSAPMDICGVSGPSGGYGCCSQYAYPLKTSLYYTDQNGTKSLVFIPFKTSVLDGLCTSGNWQLCYDAPVMVVADIGCQNPRAGVTPLQVGFCPLPSLTYPTVGCGPLNPFGEYTDCANAPSGEVFNYERCGFVDGPYSLGCGTFGFWSNPCTDPLNFYFGDRFLRFGASPDWSVSVEPPDGFSGSGTWEGSTGPAPPCLPVKGNFTISE